MQISNYDMHVIVDNYVEMGDFFKKFTKNTTVFPFFPLSTVDN